MYIEFYYNKSMDDSRNNCCLLNEKKVLKYLVLRPGVRKDLVILIIFLLPGLNVHTDIRCKSNIFFKRESDK